MTAAIQNNLADLESERNALGAAMLEREAAQTVFASLTEGDFRYSLHQVIYRGLRELWQDGTPLDLSLVSRPLQERREWPPGQRADVYLASCLETAVGAFAPYYCERVKKAAMRRKLHQACLQAARKMETSRDDLEDTTALLREALEGVQTSTSAIGTSCAGGWRFPETTLAGLRLKAQQDGPEVGILPFLGETGLPLFVEGLSHILAAAPKAGKTTLLLRLAREWAEQGRQILFLSEEPETIWQRRMAEEAEGAWLERVVLLCCLGLPTDSLLQRMKAGEEGILILDTSKVLGIEDENDAATVNRALTPWVTAARANNETLIVAHHCAKGGGRQVEVVAGSHAWGAIFDTVLELLPDERNENHRLLRAVGRLLPACKVMYALRNGLLENLGSPVEVEFNSARERLLEALEEEWQTTSEARSEIGDSRPSLDLVSRALESLAAEGLIERDPPLSAGKKPGKTYRWRRPPADSQTSSAEPLYSGGEVRGCQTLPLEETR